MTHTGFDGKSILITGGASGIGRAAALQFAAAGARVMLADVNAEGLQQTAQHITEEGGTAYTQVADIADPQQVQALIAATIAQCGGLHVAVNSAGISGSIRTPLHAFNMEEVDQVFGINVRGLWLCMKYEIPAMLEQGGGAIINLASVAGLLGVRGGGIYAASKHAVIGLTKSAALDYATTGIRINAICPSFIETPMVTNITAEDEFMEKMVERASPMRRLGTPDEIAAAIVWMASAEASFVNGVAFAIDGGLTAM